MVRAWCVDDHPAQPRTGFAVAKKTSHPWQVDARRLRSLPNVLAFSCGRQRSPEGRADGGRQRQTPGWESGVDDARRTEMSGRHDGTQYVWSMQILCWAGSKQSLGFLSVARESELGANARESLQRNHALSAKLRGIGVDDAHDLTRNGDCLHRESGALKLVRNESVESHCFRDAAVAQKKVSPAKTLSHG